VTAGVSRTQGCWRVGLTGARGEGWPCGPANGEGRSPCHSPCDERHPAPVFGLKEVRLRLPRRSESGRKLEASLANILMGLAHLIFIDFSTA